MLFTIEGFSQQALLDHGLDPIDAVILRWIMNFWGSGHMKTYRIKRREYFWLKYEYVLQEIPIIRIKTPIALRRRFVKYVKEGIMASETIRGNVTCYRFTKKFYTLMSKPSQKIEQEEWLIQEESQGVAKPKSLRDTSGLSQEIEQSKQPKQGKSQGGPKPKSLPPKPKSLGGKPKSLALYNKDDSKINNSKITTTTEKEDLTRLEQETVAAVAPEKFSPKKQTSYLSVVTHPNELENGKLIQRRNYDATSDQDTQHLSRLAELYELTSTELEKFMWEHSQRNSEMQQPWIANLTELEKGLEHAKSKMKKSGNRLGFLRHFYYQGKFVKPSTHAPGMTRNVEQSKILHSFKPEEIAAAKRQAEAARK